MSKKNLNSVNNEFIEYLKGSLKVSDHLIKINIDILMTKDKSYINIKNRNHIIRNDTLINKTNRIKLESMIRKNVESLKNIKNNHYSVKKYTDNLSIDLKKLKEEHINNSNKRVKVRSIVINIKVNRFNKRFNRFNKRFNRFINKPSSKTNARTIKDNTIVKNHVDACTNTDDLAKNHVDACTNTDDLVKNHVDACTNTDDVCTNENEPCTNENEPCANDDDSNDDSDDDSNDKLGNSGNNDNKPGNSGNNDNKPGNSGNKDNNDNKPGKNDNKDNKDNKQGNKDNKQGNKDNDNDNKPVNNDNKESRQMNFAISLRKLFK